MLKSSISEEHIIHLISIYILVPSYLVPMCAKRKGDGIPQRTRQIRVAGGACPECGWNEQIVLFCVCMLFNPSSKPYPGVDVRSVSEPHCFLVWSTTTALLLLL